ncbi:hypothetical protein LPJ60_005641, partial [Coemansia sp. RSA 2675]
MSHFEYVYSSKYLLAIQKAAESANYWSREQILREQVLREQILRVQILRVQI